MNYDYILACVQLIAKSISLAWKEQIQADMRYLQGMYKRCKDNTVVCLYEGTICSMSPNLYATYREFIAESIEITNLGASGVEYFTPILNVGEVGILGIGALQESLVLTEEGQVEKQQSIPFSLTFDHQVLDGADAAEFLTLLVRYIEKPTLLLI